MPNNVSTAIAPMQGNCSYTRTLAVIQKTLEYIAYD